MMLDTMPNLTGQTHKQSHILDLKPMCPVSRNPQAGSTVTITYYPGKVFLEVYSLRAFVDSFIGGREYKGVFVRDMEQTIQVLAEACTEALETPVHVLARLLLDTQEMIIEIGEKEVC